MNHGFLWLPEQKMYVNMNQVALIVPSEFISEVDNYGKVRKEQGVVLTFQNEGLNVDCTGRDLHKVNKWLVS